VYASLDPLVTTFIYNSLSLHNVKLSKKTSHEIWKHATYNCINGDSRRN